MSILVPASTPFIPGVVPPGIPPVQAPAPRRSLFFLFSGINSPNGENTFRILNVKVLFSVTAIVYQTSKVFLFEKLLVREVYRIIKLLKKIFSFIEGTSLEELLSYRLRILATEQEARHVFLKLFNNSLSVISGIYDLATDNEIIKLGYVALGLGNNFQPLSEGVRSGFETFLMPLAAVKMATKSSHFYLAAKKVYQLDSTYSTAKKRDTWVILAKASLDFGIEAARWGLYFAGLTSGSILAVSISLSVLGVVSNSLGLYKHLFPVKENAQIEPNAQIELIVPPQP